MQDYKWIAELAMEAKCESTTLGNYFAKTIKNLNFNEIEYRELRKAWTILTRDFIYHELDEENKLPPDIDATFVAFKNLSIDKFNHTQLNETIISKNLQKIFEQFFKTISNHPEILDLFEEREIISDVIFKLAKRFMPFVQLLPAFTSKVLEYNSNLKESLFTALYEIEEIDQDNLYKLSKTITRLYYFKSLRPKLEIILKSDIKNQKILLPLLDEAIIHLPIEKCATSLIHIFCTPKNELTVGKIISILFQELGGIYVKLAQIITEIVPPALSKELKNQQDKLAGIFGSKTKSWEYVLEILSRPSLRRLKKYLIIPSKPKMSFAGASIGAIYEFELTASGKSKLKTNKTILLKIQRPGLHYLFQKQEETILLFLDQLNANFIKSDHSNQEKEEISAYIDALKKSLINFSKQSSCELDFRIEKRNAEIIREALRGKYNLKIPHYYHVEKDILLMEKMGGEKITSIVHSRYLEKMKIADTVSDAYLYLMFRKGVIWADPHAGNILYDPIKLKINLIDLTPCFIWDHKTIKTFIGFLYRLILSDEKGVLKSLHLLIDNSEILEDEKNKNYIKSFIANGYQDSFIKYLSDFLKMLGEANLNLKLEVQAAFRGIIQIYLTSSSISSGNNFGQIFQNQFGWKMVLEHILSIGPFKVAKAALPIAFDLVKNSPEQEVGPTLDERDITAIECSLFLLNHENVCNIEMLRTSPDENTQLTLSTDGSRLIKSVNLKIDILTETKPASVKYILEIPTKDWLKDRQEYIKLQGMGFALCLVECLEQLRRQSLESYWYVVESWNIHPDIRNYHVSNLLSEVRVAARNLFSKRYAGIWDSEFMPISNWNKFLWKFLIFFEERFEKRENGHFYNLNKKWGKERLGRYTIGTLYRIKVITYRLIIQWIKKMIKRSQFQLNLLPLSTDDLIERMIYGLLRKGRPKY